MINSRRSLRVALLSCIFLAVAALINPSPSWAQNDEEELFFVAQKAFEDGFYDISIRYTNQFLERYPNTDKNIQANLLLGQCYFFKSQYLKAYEIFQELLDYDEFQDAALFWLGETYLKGADYVEAERQYKKVIKEYPNSLYLPQAYYSLGWAYFEQEKYEPAQDAFLKLMQQFPASPFTEDAIFKTGECKYNLKNYEAAIHYFKDSVVRFPKSKRHAESYFYIAESYYFLEDYLSASTYYAKASNIAKDQKVVLMSKISLGWSYIKLNRPELSLKAFEEAKILAEEIGSLSDDIFLGLASLYAEMGKHDKALAEYKLLIENFPDSPRALEALLGEANIYYLERDYAKAIDGYKSLIAKFPEKTKNNTILEKAQFGLAWTYLKNGNFEDAIGTFEKIVSQNEKSVVKVSALTQIAEAYHENGEFDKAIEVYDKILLDYPNSLYTDYAQFRQAIALLKQDNIEAATLSFQSLSANFPKSKYLTDTKYYLAVAYFKKGDWSMAQQQVKAFLNSITENNEFAAESLYILGISTFNLKKPAEALAIFKDIIARFPNHKEISRNSELGLAKSLYEMGKEEEALKEFNSIILKYQQLPIAQEALFWLGDYYLRKGMYLSAIEYYEDLIQGFPGSDRINFAYYENGQAHEALEEYDKALFNYSKIANPNDKEVYAKAKLAIAGILSKTLDYDKALETYNNIIQTVPDYKRDTYIRMASMYKAQQEYQESIKSYEKALSSQMGLSLTPDPEIQFMIGDTYEILNDNTRAAEEYFKIPYLYPEATPWIIKAYLRIARIFEDQENWFEAEKVYNKIIEYETDESIFARERLDWIKENFNTIQ